MVSQGKARLLGPRSKEWVQGGNTSAGHLAKVEPEVTPLHAGFWNMKCQGHYSCRSSWVLALCQVLSTCSGGPDHHAAHSGGCAKAEPTFSR